MFLFVHLLYIPSILFLWIVLDPLFICVCVCARIRLFSPSWRIKKHKFMLCLTENLLVQIGFVNGLLFVLSVAKGSEIIGVVNWLICWNKKHEKRPPLLAQLCFLPPSIFTVSSAAEDWALSWGTLSCPPSVKAHMAYVFKEWFRPWDFRWSLVGHSFPAGFVIGHFLPGLLLSCVSLTGP